MKKKTPRNPTKNPAPKFLIIYKCQACDQDCAYTDLHRPRCRVCGRNDKLVIVSKEAFTFEAMVNRLKDVTDNIMSNLSKAYEQLPHIDVDVVEEGKDGETELLKIMDKAKKLRDKVHALKKKSD